MSILSIVIPVFNEAANIAELYRRLAAVLDKDFSALSHEIIFIDDGSRDGTVQKIRLLAANDQRVCLVEFSRNFGHHVAISAGLDHARGDYVVTMDGDLQDQPEEISKLFHKMLEGYDVVYGERCNKKFPWYKRLTSTIFFKILRLFLNEKLDINANVFRIMTRPVVDAVKRCCERGRYVPGLVAWVGFRQSRVFVEHGERFAGDTKYSFFKRLNLAFDTIFSFSDYPLKLISRLGFCLVIFSFILGSHVIFRRLFFGIPVLGWASLISSIFFIGGVQIFITGIIGEYLGRVYMEEKGRPLYIVKATVGFDVQGALSKIGQTDYPERLL